MRKAARQMSRMRSGFFSDLRRERAARDLSLLERGVLELGFRIDEKFRRWIEVRRSFERKAMIQRAKERMCE